ncbi:MAG: PIN domain-containing protein [Kiritimatiellae bacterium]|nr:PIN domain-containing protein [Kiritimatiellia bacterium]
MRVLVDTNVVLDVLLARKPFAQAATELFAMAERSEIEAFLCATTITTVDYLLNQSLSRAEAQKALHRLLELFEIAPVNRSVIEEALGSKVADFEDAVLEHAGRLAGAEAVVTRNTKDFRKASIKAIDPTALLSMIKERAAANKALEHDSESRAEGASSGAAQD